MIANAAAQKVKFDIATFTPPKGWQRIDSNGIIGFFDSKPAGTGTTFCQLFIYPSNPGSGNSTDDFNNEWNKHVVSATGFAGKPTTQKGSADGWDVITGYSNITQQGVTFTCMVVTISGFGRSMCVLANLAGQDYMNEVQSFLNNFDVDSKAASAMKPTSAAQDKSSVSIKDYQFVPPARWYTYKNPNYIVLSSSQSAEYGCLLNIFPAQPSSGNLQTDARNIFNQMYNGWEYRWKGDQREDVSMGYTLQGLEYCMIEAAMQKRRPDGYYYDFENGQVLVISVGKQIIIITGRHQRGEMVCFCKNQYDYWDQFFNSFTVNGIAPKKINDEASKRIVGTWQTMGSNALTKCIFAANGRYQWVGAIGSTSRISSDLIEIRTSGFNGDGAYSINENKLTTTKDHDKPEVYQYRFDKVNHGGTAWKDRLYLLSRSQADGTLYQVCYEKQE